MATHASNLVDDVLETNDISSKVLLHLGVGFYMDSFIAYFSMQFFINKLRYQCFGWLAPCDVILDALKKTNVGGSAFDEDCSIDFSEIKFGEDDFLRFGDVGGTSNSDCND